MDTFTLALRTTPSASVRARKSPRMCARSYSAIQILQPWCACPLSWAASTIRRFGPSADGTTRRIVLAAKDRGQAHHGCSIWIAEYDPAHILGDFRARTLALGAVRKANVKVSMIG